MKSSDAIHVAKTTVSDCDIFLTNDKNIQTPKGFIQSNLFRLFEQLVSTS